MPAYNLGQILGDASSGFMAGEDRGQSRRLTEQKAQDSHRLMAEQIKGQQVQNNFNQSRATIEETKANEVLAFFGEQQQQNEAKTLMNNTIRNIGNIYTDSKEDGQNAERVVQEFNTMRNKSPRIQSYLPRLTTLNPNKQSDLVAIQRYLSKTVGVEDQVINELDDSFYQEFTSNGAFAGDVNPETGELDEIFETASLWGAVDSHQSMSYDAKMKLSNTMKAITGTLIDKSRSLQARKPTTIEEREEMFNDMVEIEAIPAEQRTTKQKTDLVRYTSELTKAYETTAQRNKTSDIQSTSEVLGGDVEPQTTTEKVQTDFKPDTSATTREAKTRNTKSIYTKDMQVQEKSLKETRKSINDVQELVTSIEASAKAGTYNTGPIDYWIDLGLDKVGAVTEQQVKDQVVKAGVDTKTGQLIGKVVKQISGASATEDEYRRKMIEVFGSPDDQTEVRIAHMKAYLETLENDEADLTIELEKFLPVTTNNKWRRGPMSVNNPTTVPSEPMVNENGRTEAQESAASKLGF